MLVGFVLSYAGRLHTPYIYSKISVYVAPIVVIAFIAILQAPKQTGSKKSSNKQGKAGKNSSLGYQSVLISLAIITAASSFNATSNNGSARNYLHGKFGKFVNIIKIAYLHRRENGILDSTKDDIEYIYVLTNPGYPDLVKIGMTERTVEGRVRSVNRTSTVHEWVPKFALPVSKGNAFRVEQQVHKYFSDKRISSDHGNEREFFQIHPLNHNPHYWPKSEDRSACLKPIHIESK